jgi:hypothetical protein
MGHEMALAAALPAPLHVLLAWSLLLPALCGIGFAAARLFQGPPERIDASLAFWLGTAISCALLAAWHLFFCIDGWVWAMLGPLAVAGLVFELRDHRPTAAGLLRGRAAAWSVLAAFALWLATRAVLPASSPDDGLYYTQTVRWNSLHAAVPGLGNLHPYLVYNNAYHLFVAALGVGPFHLRGHHLANGLFLLATVAACGAGALRMIDPRKPLEPADCLAALLLGPALDFSVYANLSVAAADFAVHMFGTGLLLAALTPILRSAPIGSRRMTAVLAACAGAVICKQSLVCIALPMAACAVAHWSVHSPATRTRPLLGAMAICAAIATPWLAHGVILSGFPLYPAPWPDLGIGWRMDRANVLENYRWVYAFARWPGHSWAEVTASRHWVAVWFGREWLNNRAFLLPAALAVAGTVALASGLLAGRRPPRSLFAALGPVLFGIATWWLLAPDTRFAGPLLWSAGGLLALAGASSWLPLSDGWVRWTAAVVALAVAGGAFLGWQPSFAWRSDFPALRHNQATVKVRLSSGEVVDASVRADCWDPPCAFGPPLDPRLRLRKPGKWSAGFTLEPAP